MLHDVIWMVSTTTTTMATPTLVPTLQDIFASMQEAAQANEELQKKFAARVEFDVDGAKCSIATTHAPTKNVLHVTTSLETLQALLNQDLTPQQAFLKGKLKIKGKMSLAMKLTLLLDATRNDLKRRKQSRL